MLFISCEIFVHLGFIENFEGDFPKSCRNLLPQALTDYGIAREKHPQKTEPHRFFVLIRNRGIP